MSRTIHLVSTITGKHLTVNESVIKLSSLINNMLEDDEDDVVEIPLNYDHNEIEKIINFCNNFAIDPYKYENRALSKGKAINSSNIDTYVSEWYVNFVKSINNEKYVEIANFLDIRPMVELLCLNIACMMKGKTTEEILAIFSKN